jgi:hypothetical protein
MQALDPDEGRPRGYLLLSAKAEPVESDELAGTRFGSSELHGEDENCKARCVQSQLQSVHVPVAVSEKDDDAGKKV